ncbi:MAG: hypothetical protein LBD88_05285 [Candidatus Peribacteria bacterium]|jgi:hypothetical protein|nr:hypothetical protein [Candidatus Peribacteria bacterium]
MNYNKFQKFISGLLIFSLLFGITFRFPFFEFGVSANNRDIFDLVSIIVDEDTYSKVNDELQRYGKDISSVLENTKTVILPVPKNVTAFQIASMNEALFYE